MDFIDKDNLYGNDYNSCALCEYTRELKLIKRLIDIADIAIQKEEPINTWSYDGICHTFAKTIVDYSKMAYDNVLLGNFHAVNMINRAVLENCVCLDIIIHNDDYELWKYYWVHSYWNSIHKSNSTPSQKEIDRLESLYKELNISEDFYVKQGNRRKAYIQESYGWTYKINHNKQFNFANICKIINSDTEYRGFQLMSDYSHGTSFGIKLHSSVFVENMMSMFVDIYINLYRMVTLYCWDLVDDEFEDITEELEDIFYRFIEYEESVYENNN